VTSADEASKEVSGKDKMTWRSCKDTRRWRSCKEVKEIKEFK
jgi:hypothetical protein